MGNQVRTVFFLGILSVLLVWFGGFFGREGMILAFLFALAMNGFAYFFSDRLVLAMYRARPILPEDSPRLHQTVDRLARSAGVPCPKLYLIPSENPNAFATGRDPAHASVAVTDGILNLLTEDELSGVLAHEIGHVKDRDILIGTVAATIAGAITFLARMLQYAAMFGGMSRDNDRGSGNPIGLAAMLLLAILAPIAAMLVQLAISRSREYLADEEGARICGNPRFLADALRKLVVAGACSPMRQANPATSHLFIVNPFSGKALFALFSTHPPIEERIRRLESLTI